MHLRRISKAGWGLAICLVLGAGLVTACQTSSASQSDAARDEPVDVTPYWMGSYPCDVARVMQFKQLPNGAPRVVVSETGQQRFRLPSGVIISVNPPVITSYPVRGDRYSLAYAHMLWGPTAQKDAQNKGVTLASVDMRTEFYADARDSRQSGPTRYSYIADDLRFDFTPTFTFPSWTEEREATLNHQNFWQRKLCSLIHHEMAHVLITLQAFEERADALVTMRAPTLGGLQSQSADLLKSIKSTAERRHDTYHTVLEQQGKAAMEARPYWTYDWPWLSANENIAMMEMDAE